MSRTKFYELIYKGVVPSVEFPSRGGARSTRRVEQAAIDAFIDAHRVTSATTPGGVPPVTGSGPCAVGSKAPRRAAKPCRAL